MRVLRGPLTDISAALIFLDKLQAIQQIKEELSLKDLCVLRICPVQVLGVMKSYEKSRKRTPF